MLLSEGTSGTEHTDTVPNLREASGRFLGERTYVVIPSMRVVHSHGTTMRSSEVLL